MFSNEVHLSTWPKLHIKGVKVSDTISMESKASNVFESKSLVKNDLGIYIACIQLCIFAASLATAIAFEVRKSKTGIRRMGAVEEFLCWAIGMVPKFVQGHGRNYATLNFILFISSCLFQMYIPFMALIRPSFLAGKPEKKVKRFESVKSTFSNNLF